MRARTRSEINPRVFVYSAAREMGHRPWKVQCERASANFTETGKPRAARGLLAELRIDTGVGLQGGRSEKNTELQISVCREVKFTIRPRAVDAGEHAGQSMRKLDRTDGDFYEGF